MLVEGASITLDSRVEPENDGRRGYNCPEAAALSISLL